MLAVTKVITATKKLKLDFFHRGLEVVDGLTYGRKIGDEWMALIAKWV